MKTVMRLMERLTLQEGKKKKDLEERKRKEATMMKREKEEFERRKKKAEAKEKEKSKQKGKEKVKSTSDKGFSLRGALSVGEFDGARCCGKLTFTDDYVSAAGLRKDYGGRDSSDLFSIGLLVKQGVDDFELGELSGNLKDIVAESLKEMLMFRNFKVTVDTTKDGNRIFRLTFVYDDHEQIEILTGILSALQLRKLSGNIELSQRPTDDDADGEFLKLRMRGHAVLGTGSVEFLQSLTSEGYEASAKGTPGDAFALLTAMKNVDVDMKFDDIGEMYRRAFKDSPGADLHGWSSAKAMGIKFFKKEVIKDPQKIPPPVVAAYINIRNLLVGINDVFAQLGDCKFTIEFKDVNVIEYLPSETELGLEY